MEEQNDPNGGHRDQRIRMDYLEEEIFFWQRDYLVIIDV